MRKLVCFTLGFGASCGLCGCLLPLKLVLPLGMSVLLFAGALFLLDKRRLLRRGCLVLLGIGLGLFWYAGFYHLRLTDAVEMDGKNASATVILQDFGWDTDYGSAAQSTVTLQGKSYTARIYFRESLTLKPGDTFSGEFRFRVTTPDGSEKATHHRGKGIFLILYQTGEIVSGEPEDSALIRIARLRQEIRNTLTRCFPSDTAGFAKALLLGDTDDLDYGLDTDLKLSGIRHVASVSGLHVSVLFTLISAVTLKRRLLRAVVGFPALFLFAALAGFTPSITRACLMWVLILGAQLLDKDYDGATALSFASLVMLMVNPLAITDAGFQLSVGSVAGIYLFCGPLKRWICSFFGEPGKGTLRARVARWVSSSASVSLSAMAITAPMSAWHFGTVSLVSVAANLLTLWVITVVFWGILLVCLLSLFWSAGAVVLGAILSWPIRYVLAVAAVLADFPIAAVYTCSPYVFLWLVMVYLLTAVCFLQKKRSVPVLLCCAALGLCAALTASWAEPLMDSFRFTMLDVGQGQCLLIQSQGRTYMVDCGGEWEDGAADTAAEALLSQGTTHLDGIILTHWDDDHAGGLPGLLSRVDADLLILPGEHPENALATQGEILYASQDLELTFGSAKMRIFPAPYPKNASENSLCVLFESPECDILITGDRNAFGERTLLRNADIPEVDILVAGHHGSAYSTSEELLAAVQPEMVCISAGRDNSYGHPAPALLERLEKSGCRIYRTDIHGDIFIRR